MRLVVVAITLVAGTAHANPEAAKQLAVEAEALVASGDLVGAGAKFRAAYAAEPRPEYMCNAGVAYHKAKDLPRSHRYLNSCVTMGSALDPTYRANLQAVVEGIQAQLVAGDFTPIDIALDPPTAMIVFEGGKPYDEAIVGGGRIWVPYGSYQLIVRADGYVDGAQTIEAKSHDAMPLRVTLEKKPVEKPFVQPMYREVGPSKLPAIVATSATGAIAIGAVVAYVLARGDVDDAEDAIDREAFDDLHDSAHEKQKISWVLAGAAGVGAVVSTYLWYRVLTTPSTKIEIAPTGNGIGVRGTF